MNNFNPDTMFVGRQAYFLDETISTNNWLGHFVRSRAAQEGCLVHAEFQQQGKGRMQKSWISDKGMNILVSFLLKPHFMQAGQQSNLNLAVALAVHDTLSFFINDPIFVKWPNDIICDNKKLSGILIENIITGSKIENSLVGIGINVNQQHFTDDLHATSVFQLTGRYTPREDLLATLCQQIELRYFALRQSKQNTLLTDYNRLLYGKHKVVTIKSDSGFEEGVIQEVLPDGSISIVTKGELKRYQFNSVKLYYNGFNS